MARMIIGFDPSRAQPALDELGQGLGPGVEWRVLGFHQNPNGVEPTRAQVVEEEHEHEHDSNLLQRLAGWLGGDKESEGAAGARHSGQQPVGAVVPGSDALALSEEELAYLRAAPARVGTVVLITAPEAEASAVRLWSMRHGGFSLSPIPAPEAETQIKEN